MKKEVWIAYLLCLATVFGPAGLHRFYLGRYGTGLLYFFTFGLLGIGTLVDLFTIPDMVAAENAKALPPSARDVHLHLHGGDPSQAQAAVALLNEHKPGSTPSKGKDKETSPERQILNLAKQQDGRVTVPMVALGTNLSLDDAKKELERLREAGYCQFDVSEEGAELYNFVGLGSTKPLLT